MNNNYQDNYYDKDNGNPNKKYFNYDIPLLIIVVFVFLITAMYLEKNNTCEFGFRSMVGDSSFTLISYLLVIICVVFIIKIFNYRYKIPNI